MSAINIYRSINLEMYSFNILQLKVFFDKMTKILAFYTDMELCASVQKETDYETTNRIECVYRANLEVTLVRQ